MERLKTRMEHAAEAAVEAGRIARSYFQGDLAVETKPDRSPVTAADRETEAFLREFLLSRYRGDAFFGEEGGERPGTSGYRWVVDPIDGTKAFIQGVPLWGVLVGLEGPGKEALAGAVSFPVLGDLVVAARGEGATWNGQRVRVSEVGALDRACVLCAEEEFLSDPRTLELRRRLHGEARLVRGWGDCFGHVLVATGRAEAMLDPIVADWDAVALAPIVEEAGGVFTDWRGRRTAFGRSAVSTNAALAGAVRSLIAPYERGARP